jgi:hypothetical protein
LTVSSTLSDYEQKIIDNVAEHGWFCVSVFGNPDPTFSYTVGLWETLGTPELIIFGQPLKLMHSMLWTAFRQIKAGKTRVRDGERWSGLIDGFDCISRPVHESQIVRDHFNSAIWYHGYTGGDGKPLSAFQLFWPGVKDGLFPWEKNCGEAVRELQPLLYLPIEPGAA